MRMIKVHESLPSLKALHQKYAVSNSVAIEAGGLIFMSGMSGNLGNAEDEGRPFRDQALNALRKVTGALEEIGYSADHVIKVNAYLRNPSDFAVWNEVYKGFFKQPLPCRTTIGSPLVIGDIEIEAVAAQEPRTAAE
jgi:enamine deaminase RidA (YjgF/YER057c/UK114 family)